MSMKKTTRTAARALILLIGAVLMPIATAAAETADTADAAADSPRADASVNRSIARLAEQARRMIPRHEYSDALQAVNQGLAIDPTYIPLWRLKALAHIALGQNAEAEEALGVCLLRDPLDIEANVLLLKNAMEWAGADTTGKIRRVASRLGAMPTPTFQAALLSFMKRNDFPENLSLLLTAWNQSGRRLASVRRILDALSSNHLNEAMNLVPFLDDDPDISPELRQAVHDLLDKITAPDSTFAWTADRGRIHREGQGYRLSPVPAGDSFAWLRFSPGWRDVAATLELDDASTATRNLYLRYRGNDSYVRISQNENLLLLQERVPGAGLFTIWETPRSELAGQPLRVYLKSERVILHAGETPLTEIPIPISAKITEGRVALAGDNPPGMQADAVFPAVHFRRIDPAWVQLTGREPRELALKLLNDGELTGLFVNFANNAAGLKDGGQDGAGGGPDALENIPTLLLTAVNSGLAVFAGLPEGALDLTAMRRPLERLPKMLADRIWTGAVVNPAADQDLEHLAGFLREIRASGLQSGLFVNAATARRLAAHPGDLYADWFLVGRDYDGGMNELERFHSGLLYEAADGSGTFGPQR